MLKLKYIYAILFIFYSGLMLSQVLYNNGRQIYINSEAQVYLNGSLTNEYGNITISQNDTNNAEVHILGDLINNDKINGQGIISLHGNWTNNSDFQCNQGTVNLESAEQNIGGDEETVFFNLNLHENGQISLSNSVYVTGRLNLKSSVINTQNHSLNITNTDTASLLVNDGFICSSTGGYLSRKTQTKGNYLFPLGSDFEYPIKRNIIIKPSIAELSEFNARFVNVNPNDQGYYTSLLNDSIEYVNDKYFHLINRISGVSNVSLTMIYESEDGDFNHIANWSSTPNPAWNLLNDSYIDSLSIETNIRIDEISDFSNPQFIFCYKGSAPADSIPEPEPEPEELENIIIYNSFSPNGDGFNDTWIIDNCPNCNVKVYNRNGNIVFSSDDNSISWDGKYNNKKVPDATYYYIISPSNSTEIIKGSVTIIR